MKKILSLSRAAIDKYGMIEDGDKICVGVSGGKDSLCLLLALAKLRDFYPHKFRITAVSVDMKFNNSDGDFSKIREFCNENNIEYIVRPTNLYELIFLDRREKNPCALCSKMRRGILIKTAKELGCNKLALGHNSDDVAETFFMNLFDGGRIGTFSPKSYMSRSGITVIRPLVYVSESITESAAERLSLPVYKSPCPMDKNSERERLRQFVLDTEKSYPGLRSKLLSALEKDGLSEW